MDYGEGGAALFRGNRVGDNDGQPVEPRLRDRVGGCAVEEQLDEKRSKAQEEDVRTVVKCPYHRVFLLILSVAGLFHPTNFRNCGGKWRVPIAFYSSCVFLFMAANAVRVLATAFDKNVVVSPAFFSTLSTVTWICLVTLNFCIHYVICFTREHGVAGYYRKLDEATEEMKALGIFVPTRGARQFEVGCVAVSLLLTVANVGLSCSQLSSASSSNLTSALLRPRGDNQTAQAEYKTLEYATMVFYAYASAAWILPVTYVLVISKQIAVLFESFNRKFEHLATTQPQLLLGSIGSYRLAYCHLRKIVAFVDGYFMFTYGLHFGAYLALSMLQLYLLVTYEEIRRQQELLGGMITWFVSSMTIFAFELGASCVILSKAKECGQHLQELPAQIGSSTNEQLIQIQLLLAHVREDAGFTIFSCILVSSDAVSAIIGTWMTYFLIIMQFSPPST